MAEYRVAVVGATGLVGQELVKNSLLIIRKSKLKRQPQSHLKK